MDRRDRPLLPRTVTPRTVTPRTVISRAVTKLAVLIVPVLVLASACGDDGAADDTGSSLFPDVIGVESELDGGTWTFSVTISSPYDTAQQYADAWRVVGPDGTEYGVRILTHDHADEQPFTRRQSGITIPDDVDVVTVQARDLLNGWGGATLEHELER